MTMPKIYLGGPINGRTDRDCRDWRARVGVLLGTRADVLDPMRRDYRGREREPGVDREIVAGDEADIRASSACLFRWDGKGSAGTTMELCIAHRMGKPCVVWDDRLDRPALSPWVTAHAAAIETSLAAAVERALEFAGAGRPERCRIERDFRFEAAHFLPRVPEGHKCGRVHGHSYLVTLALEGEVCPKVGWVRDFADVTAAWAPIGAALDHRLLNEVEGLENPTSEVLARWLAGRLQPALPELAEVRVSETCASRAVYRT